MKRKITREMTIGISLLAVLLVILGVVAARRFMRPRDPAEQVIAGETHEERTDEHRLKRDGEFAAKADVSMPEATTRRDGFQPLDKPDHGKNSEKEKEKLAGAAALGLAAAEHPDNLKPALPRREERQDAIVVANQERQKHDGERTSTYAPPELTPVTGDDRYSPAAANESPRDQRRQVGREASAPVLSPAPAVGRSEPVVIQVSNGESADGAPRPMERYESGVAGERLRAGTPRTETFVPEAPRGRFENPGAAAAPEAAHGVEEKAREREFRDNAPAADGTASDPDAARRRAEKIREHELQAVAPQADPSLGRGNYIPEPPRAAPASPYYQGAPMGDAATGYSQSPGGYGPQRGRQLGAEIREPIRPQIPLREDGMYEVQPNDSYWTISERVYGSGAYFRAMAEQNRGKAARPDRLPPGLLISTPPVARLEKDYPDLCPRPNRRETVRNRAATATLAATAGGGRTYVVQEGDTLSSIARNELGKVSRWAEIYQINREALGKDYDYLVPGMKLVLPIRDVQSGDRTTRRDESGPPLLR